MREFIDLANSSLIVTETACGTAVIFVSLSLYGVVSKRDISVMGGFLMTGLIVIILAGVANFWPRMPVLQLVVAVAALLIFAG